MTDQIFLLTKQKGSDKIQGTNLNDLKTLLSNFNLYPKQKLFYVYDSAGGNIIGAYETINMDTITINTGEFSLLNDEVTVNSEGMYLITAKFTARTRFSTLNSSYVNLQIDTGTGFTDLPSSFAYVLNTTNSALSSTLVTSCLYYFYPGYKVRLRARSSTSSIRTTANSSSIFIQSIKEFISVTTSNVRLDELDLLCRDKRESSNPAEYDKIKQMTYDDLRTFLGLTNEIYYFEAYDATGGLSVLTESTINFDTVRYNSGHFSYSSGIVTFNYSGRYAIVAKANYEPDHPHPYDTMDILVYSNGSLIPFSAAVKFNQVGNTGTRNDNTSNFTKFPREMNVGDTIEVRVRGEHLGSDSGLTIPGSNLIIYRIQ